MSNYRGLNMVASLAKVIKLLWFVERDCLFLLGGRRDFVYAFISRPHCLSGGPLKERRHLCHITWVLSAHSLKVVQQAEHQGFIQGRVRRVLPFPTLTPAQYEGEDEGGGWDIAHVFLSLRLLQLSRYVLSLTDRFLNLKIQEGEAHNIFCPAYDCFQLVPVEVIESVVSREMDKRYLQFDIKVWLQRFPGKQLWMR